MKLLVVALLLAYLPASAAESFDELMRRAEAGDADAQHAFALMLRDSELDRDLVAAVRWFRAAAEQGHKKAQGELGLAYVLGEGVDDDFRAGHFWLLLAGESGSERARRALASLTEHTDAPDVLHLSARAAAWKPGAPSMPYVTGMVAYVPLPPDPHEPLPPAIPWTLTDAVAVRPDWPGEPGAIQVLTAPWLVTNNIDKANDAPRGLAAYPGLTLTFTDEGKLGWITLRDGSDDIEIDAAHFDGLITTQDDAVRGHVRNREDAGMDKAGAWIDIHFAMPLYRTDP